MAAGSCLDATLDTLAGNFSSSNQYFALLVKVHSPLVLLPLPIFLQVFSSQLSASSLPHLATFHLILPPLTVNYIEHLTAAKEKIFKKNLEGATFTEDGFAMGLAYCLTLLDQWRQADSLHWSVQSSVT